uniref:Beta-crystallin A2 n=1 Tax=Poecilia mexicana TaxID=48701 RepID=A0A3B3Y5U3_9TELE
MFALCETVTKEAAFCFYARPNCGCWALPITGGQFQSHLFSEPSLLECFCSILFFSSSDPYFSLLSRWVGYEYPEFQGQQFILEKGDYPRYEAWSGNSSYRTEHMLSFRPIKCANHSDSKVTLYECEDFQGRKFEMCDDYPSLQAMGWCSKEVPSMKVNSGAWVAYQFPGYRGYQYILERDRHQGEYRNYNEFSTQAHTNQVQSIRRIQH